MTNFYPIPLQKDEAERLRWEHGWACLQVESIKEIRAVLSILAEKMVRLKNHGADISELVGCYEEYAAVLRGLDADAQKAIDAWEEEIG